VWKKKELPLTRVVPIRRAELKAGSTRGDAETMPVNPHVPVNAGTASWAAEPGWEKGHQPEKTQAGTWTRGSNTTPPGLLARISFQHICKEEGQSIHDGGHRPILSCFFMFVFPSKVGNNKMK